MLEFLQNSTDTRIRLAGETVVRIPAAAGATDTFEPIEDGVWKWTRKTAAPTAHMRMTAVLVHDADFTMVPGISYGGNGWGNTPEYVGDRAEDGTPWSFASHRATIPACTYSENGRASLALFAADPDDSTACSLYKTDEGENHVLIFPEEERPKTLQRHFWGDAFVGEMQPTDTFCAILCVWPSDGTRHRYAPLCDFAWRFFGHPLTAPKAARKLYRLSIAYCRYLFERERDGFAGFTMGAQWHLGITAYQKTVHRYEISWVGQSASMANAYIHDYLMTGDREKLDIALEVHDSWLRAGRFPAGHVAARLDFDPWLNDSYPADYEPDRWKIGECTYETHLAWRGKTFRRDRNGRILLSHDACNNGGAADGYFEAYDLLKEAGIDKPEYLAAAYGICDFALQNQNDEGAFAKSWDESGKVLADRGTVGAFLILPLVTAYKKSENETYLTAAERAFAYYYGALVRDGFTTAGALDTYCIDKESASPMLRAALALYDVTGDRAYVAAAEKIAWYLATWTMHFTVKYPADSMLGKMGWDTFGLTSVSTAHQALDQYALRDVQSFLRLYALTGRVQWRERAVAFWCAACQCISDGTMYVNGRLRPAGAQDEAIFHTRWGRHGVEPFRPSQWLPAWPCAFRLENLRRMSDWSVLDAGLGEIEGKK